MKTKTLFFLIISFTRVYGQDDSIVIVGRDSIKVNMLKPYLLRKQEDRLLTSNATLNTFFAQKISTYLSATSDLSLRRTYAVWDNTDGRVLVGGTFLPYEASDGFAPALLTAGIKANVKDKFVPLHNKNGINNDIGFCLKGTFLGNGRIYYDEDTSKASQKSQLTKERLRLSKLLFYDFHEELSKFRIINKESSDLDTLLKSFISDYTNNMRKQFAVKEAEYIEEKKLYNLAFRWWGGVDFYLPITESTYKTIPNFSTTSISTNTYRPYEANATLNFFWRKQNYRCGPDIWDIFLHEGTTLITAKYSFLINNSINAGIMESNVLDKYIIQSTNIDTLFLAKLSSQSVYVGNFETFVTHRISLRYVWMPTWVGLSGMVEKCWGNGDQKENVNWRIGAPFSIRGEKMKTEINFEVVWQEVNKKHSFGLSVGLPIGEMIF